VYSGSLTLSHCFALSLPGTAHSQFLHVPVLSLAYKPNNNNSAKQFQYISITSGVSGTKILENNLLTGCGELEFMYVIIT
jgi:hypothetical protein